MTTERSRRRGPGIVGLHWSWAKALIFRMPIIGAITGGLDFSNYFIPLSSKVTATALADAKKQGAVLAWGNFLTIVLNFLIIAFALFLAIKGINRLKTAEPPPAPAAPSKVVQLLTDIRDALKNR
jgi:large conductance mechanosensitive channel